MMLWAIFQQILSLEFSTNLQIEKWSEITFRSGILIGREKSYQALKWKPPKEMEELETALKRVEKKGLKDKMRGNESSLMSH